MILRLAAILVALALFGGEAAAQSVTFQRTSGSITAAGASCTSTTCVTIADVTRTGNGTIVISGTWAATLQFEGTLSGSTWFALNVVPQGTSTFVTSTTANGEWQIPLALVGVRVRASAYTSGTASVNLLVTRSEERR